MGEINDASLTAALRQMTAALAPASEDRPLPERPGVGTHLVISAGSAPRDAELGRTGERVEEPCA